MPEEPAWDASSASAMARPFTITAGSLPQPDHPALKINSQLSTVALTQARGPDCPSAFKVSFMEGCAEMALIGLELGQFLRKLG